VSGRQTFSATVSSLIRLNDWKTNPISLLRMRARSSRVRSLTFCPLSQYWPDVGVSSSPTI